MPIVLAVIVVTQLLFGIDATVVTVALPSVGAELGLDVVDQSWIQTAYVVAFGGLLLLGSRLGDVLGRRRTLVVGVTVFTLASLGAGLAPSGGWLIACRAAQGAGAALAGPNTMALLMVTHPAGPARNRALAVFSSVLGAGGALGLIVGGVLTSVASWRWGLLVNLPIGIAVVAVAPRVLPESERSPGRLDPAGIAASALGLAALVFGLTRAADNGWTAPGTLAALGAATVLLAAFVAIEHGAAHPVLPLDLVRSRARGCGYLAAMAASGAMFGTFFLLTQFLQEVLGIGALAAGLAFLPLMLSMLAVVRLVPRLLARSRPTVLVPCGAALMIVAALWLSRLDATSSYLDGLLGPMLLLGVGGGLTFVPLSSAVLAAVAPEHSGAAAGTLQVSQYTGTALGVAVVAAVFAAARRGGADLAGSLAAGMHGAVGFAVATALLTLAGGRAGRFTDATAPRPAR